MAIKIQTQTPTIPIEIGDLTLKFDMTDENIERLFNTHNEVSKELEGIDTDNFESVKKILGKSMDFLLGDGSFDKVYEVSKSSIIVTNYFWAIIDGLEQEIMKKAGKTQQDKVQKYLKNKNKQNGNQNKRNKK